MVVQVSPPFTARPYRGEADLPHIVELRNLCQVTDGLDGRVTIAELQHEFNDPDLEVARDVRLWETPEGQLCGYLERWVPPTSEILTGYLTWAVHPELRHTNLTAQILAWAEVQTRQLGRKRGCATRLRYGSRDTAIARRAPIEQAGFSVDRYFYQMTRSLNLPIPVPQIPAEFTLRCVNAAAEAPAWVELFNQSFVDHWNFIPLTVENFSFYCQDPHYDATLDFVAVAADGTLAGFCLSSIDPEENDRTGQQAGWVNLLGTRRSYRHRGLGRALLLTGLQALRAKGLETAFISVDSQNPSGAGKLYESVGFQHLHTNLMYVKDLTA